VLIEGLDVARVEACPSSARFLQRSPIRGLPTMGRLPPGGEVHETLVPVRVPILTGRTARSHVDLHNEGRDELHYRA
jgi:hypothetical protein